MKRLNVILTDEVQEIVERYQKEEKLGTRDETMHRIIWEVGKARGWIA